jgi:hypothetical protein
MILLTRKFVPDGLTIMQNLFMSKFIVDFVTRQELECEAWNLGRRKFGGRDRKRDKRLFSQLL